MRPKTNFSTFDTIRKMLSSILFYHKATRGKKKPCVRGVTDLFSVLGGFFFFICLFVFLESCQNLVKSAVF